MTDHVFGEDSYVECDHYHVVYTATYEEYHPHTPPKTECYCGAECVQIARVGFTTYAEEPGERDPWPKSITQSVKVHRCEAHKFEE